MDQGLLGTGVLAIWNGIAPGKESDFLRWHVGEHIPERIGVPGFLRARRYFALEGEPAYFNFYEVETPEVLLSAAYLERLNDPSDLTRAIVPHFTDTSRTLCDVAATRSIGVAGTVLTLRFDETVLDAAGISERLASAPDVSGVHCLMRTYNGPSDTSESKMRRERDGSSAAIVLVESASPNALRSINRSVLDATGLSDFGLPSPTHRGIYQLDYLLAALAAD
ncbi:DUF4286 family protein [Fulvimarina sp. 2208YS6-2-32]|uniref:DUF4286 family protein n=1 Tax=Fulvimarina uroteuthidis TaxID=3098149 RepID=A0ABU5I1T1_9HYPH|nr:DUF4286 family protein [Fulvimarina sp. 2208YS6-2-32]MDY8108728.1 DUF4286 family protein [Fulvimarina sp. 2208YS6-2-32]